MNLYKQITLYIFLLLTLITVAQTATIQEEHITLKTYPFSEPNVVPEVGRIYPYFKFDGYTTKGVDKSWKMVVLENEYIKVYVCPEIGGKIWGAIEKSTGKEFVYFNNTVKFRGVAIRGAWTSGGIEFNFGTIGHTPNCANPVDYVTKTNADGSVSCIVGAYDLTSRTRWNVEINLPKDKAYFKTKTSWFNSSSLPTSYYHWMNAAAKADGNLQFIYPGTHYIGHSGEVSQFPIEKNRDISFYEKNNFGGPKSYHVLNTYTNFFGGYWHDEKFGFGHWSPYDEKPGKKIWIWGLANDGMIWEDLLTDTDGQYVEWQAGKLFNQAGDKSTETPFKHQEFLPGENDVMEEYWFPYKGIGNVLASSPYALLNVVEKEAGYQLLICSLQNIKEQLWVTIDGKNIYQKEIHLKPLEVDSIFIKSIKSKNITVKIGNDKLVYESKSKDLKRPLKSDISFNWNSVYGNYVKGKEFEAQRNYAKAEKFYSVCIDLEPAYLPALSRLALLYYKKMDYNKALEYATKAISINTYDPEGNYIYGLVNAKLKNKHDALSGFSIAITTPQYRSASYYEITKIHFKAKEYTKALKYAQKSLESNAKNYNGLKIKAIIYRNLGKYAKATTTLTKIESRDATYNFSAFENYLQDPTLEKLNGFKGKTTNELPAQSYLELALDYYALDLFEESTKVLEIAPKDVIVNYWLSFLYKKQGKLSVAKIALNKALEASSELVFPFRQETVHILETSLLEQDHWKTRYYLGLIYWHLNKKDKAKIYFESCEMKPDFAPFYLARATLFSEQTKENQSDLHKALQLDKYDWKVNKRLSEFYTKKEDKEKALYYAQKAYRVAKSNSGVIVHLAETMLNQHEYLNCLKLLENHTLIPYEGFSKGRKIYYQACIKQAFRAFKKKRKREAVTFANKSRAWPINIGIGKPYHVDERMADFIVALVKEQSNKVNEANLYYTKVMNYKPSKVTNDTPNLLVQLVAAQKLQSLSEIETVQQYLNDPEMLGKNNRWVKEKYADYNKTKKAIKDKALIIHQVLFNVSILKN